MDTQQMIFNDAFACLLYKQNVNTFDVFDFLSARGTCQYLNSIYWKNDKLKVEDHRFFLSFLDFLTVSLIWFIFVRMKNKTFYIALLNGYVISSSWWKYCNMVWSFSKLFTRWLSRSLSQQRYVKHTICLSL